MELVQENELIQNLQTMITSYLSKNSQLTLNALAQRANVPVTSLRRLAQGQQKSEIAPHTVLNLSSYVIREKSLFKILEKVEPAIGDYLRKHFGNFIFSSETRVYQSDLNHELKDKTKYLIYKLAANHAGTDLMSVVENFGSFGKRMAEDLLNKGLLTEVDGRLHAKEKNFSLDLQVAAAHLPELVRFYKPDTIADGLNSFFSMSEALTPEAIQEIKAIQKDCVKRIHAVMNEPSAQGDVPYFTLNLAETMTHETPRGDLQ